MGEKAFKPTDNVFIEVEDAKGRITQTASYFSKLNSSGAVVETYTSVVTAMAGKLTTTNNGFNGAQKYRISVQGNTLPEGNYLFHPFMEDASGHLLQEQIQVKVDASGPMVQFAFEDNYLTNEAELTLPISLFDAIGTTISVWQNGVQVFYGEGGSFEVPLNLVEGINLFTVIATDSLGNQTTINWSGILDTTPPGLQQIAPAHNQEIATQSFIARGKATEALSAAFINDTAATIQNGNEFSAPVTAYTEGLQDLNIRLVDLMGNEESYTTSYLIAKPLLHISLVSLSPGNDNKIVVTGAPGAARDNVTVELDGGFFNTLEVIPNEDGGFTGELDFTNSIEVIARDNQFDFEEVYTLNYNVDTTLSGIVRDPTDQPLPGVKVTILSSGQEATTNASGVFAIANPALGDQTLKIDGATIPVEVTQGLREFSAVTLNVAIGNRQQNVIEKPVYISPKMLDGTETVITNDAATVESSHAPGVSLTINAGEAYFPGGGREGTINIIEIPADKTSVEMPEGVQPGTVYAFEPSGLTFSSPQELRLPNTNEFPEGMELVILSKNSESGLWELDGSATVQDGDIVTKPGQGITHFSEVFAAPFGMEISEYGSSDKPGIDSEVGVASTSIELPAYQRMGSSIAPKLVYRGSWANPLVTVTNVFNLPRKYFQAGASGGGGNIFGSVQVSEGIQNWITPESIETQLFVAGGSSERLTYKAHNAPEKAVVSYGVELDGVASGVYPSIAEYEIKYRNLTIKTTKKSERKLFGATKTKKTSSVVQDIIESIFPPELRSFVYLQNKSESEFGAGWKFAVNQKIINPASDRIMIENEDGSIGSYSLDNTVETVVHDTNGLSSVTFKNGTLHFADEKGRIFTLGEGQTTPSLMLSTGNYQGTIGINSIKVASQTTYCCESGFFGCERRCPRYRNQCEKSIYQHNISKKIHSLQPLNNGSYLFIDQHGAVFGIGNTEQVEAGDIAAISRIDISSTTASVNFQPECQNRIQTDCITDNRISYEVGGIFTTDDNRAPLSSCGVKVESSGSFPKIGYSAQVLSQSRFNKPLGMTVGNDPNILFVADTGNNVVRKINLGTNSSSIIAGTQQTTDTADGLPAISTSMFHPRAVIQDSLGNLYITTENGPLRKVNVSNNLVTTISGKPLNQGGQMVEFGPMNTFNLKSPSDMVLDEQEGYLYVADTGNHRIVQLDLQESTARVVAGNGMCDMGAVVDGRPALDTSICSPTSIALDDDKNLYFVDKNNQRLRKVVMRPDSSGTQRFASTKKDNTTLVRLANGTFERQYRDGTIAYFDAQGFHVATDDLTGRVTEFTYNQDGHVTSMKDPSGSTATFAYTGDKLIRFTDPAGRQTEFNYDGNLLVGVEFPDSTSKSFQYDTNNQLLSETDQKGALTEYNYNEFGRLASIQKGNRITTIDDSYSKNQREGQEGSDQYLVNYGDGWSNSDAVGGANSGETTTFVKDTNGYVSKIVDAQGRETTIERDAEGRPTKITRPDLSYTQMTYNPATSDLVQRYESSTDSTESFAYNQRGQLELHTAPDGKTTTRTYDTNTGVLLVETDFRGVSTTRTYGAKGLVATIKNSYNQTQSFQYGSSGNLVRVISPMGEHTDYTRDPAGNVTLKVDAKNQQTSYGYDWFNRLVTVTTPNTQQTQYEYSAAGELLKIIAPTSEETLFEYDAAGQMTKKTSPRGQVTQLAYDGNGNVVQEIDPKGQVKSFTYDNLQRLNQKVMPGNTYTYSYTTTDEIATVADNDSAFAMNYIEIHGKKYVSKVTSTVLDIPVFDTNYTYSAAGNRIGMSSFLGSVGYNYNNSNLISNVTNHKGEVFGFAYDFANRLTSMSRPGSLSTINTYDANSFLTSMTHKKSGTTISGFGYGRDQVNNRTQMETMQGTHLYQYDSEGQLTSASHPEADALHTLETFSYDSVGNRTADNQGSYSYDDNKYRLEEDWKYIYAFDLNGNVITKQEKNFGKTWNFTYSAENQLTGIEITEGANTKSIGYTYDALGRRTSKTVVEGGNTTVRKYLYDNNEMIAELDDDNAVLVKYTQSGLRTDDTLAMDVTSAGATAGIAPASGSYFFLKDGLGSIVDVTNSSGAIVQHYVYSSFGKLLKIENGGVDNTANPSIKTPFAYTNREYDQESGLYYYRARYYDAHSGRFMQEDPHSGDIRNPITVTNRYVYGGNNPVMNVDPNGRFFFAAIIIGAVLGGVIADANGGNFLEGALIGAAAGGVGAFVGGAVGLGVGNAVSGAIGGTAGSFFGGVAAFGAGAFVGGSVGGLAGGVVGAGIGAVNGRGAEEGLFYGLGLGFSVGAITGGLAGLGSYAYGDFLFNDVDFGIDAFGIKTNSIQRYIYNEAYGTASGLSKILKGPNGTEYLPVF